MKKNFATKSKNIFAQKKLIFLSLLLTIPFLIWGVFYLVSTDNREEGSQENDIVEEEIYPEYIGNNEDNPSLSVAAAYSVYYSDEKNRETILYQENPNEPLPIASISKLMTALVVFENYNLEEQVGVTEHDVVSRTEFRDYRAWTETRIEEMLYPMLIESNNSAAFALALISNRFLDDKEDSVKMFIDQMNKKAREIGLETTSFINPSGLDGRNNQYNISTAKEISIFSKYLIKNNPEIFEITAKPSSRLYSPDRSIFYNSINTNDFLHSRKTNWEQEIVGGKTGWTYAAFGCLVLVLEAPDGGYIINTVLGAEDRFQEMEKLVNYIYETHRF